MLLAWPQRLGRRLSDCCNSSVFVSGFRKPGGAWRRPEEVHTYTCKNCKQETTTRIEV